MLFNFALNIGALASSAWFLVKTPSGDDRNQCVFYLSGALRRIEVYRSVNDSLPADLADLVQWERSIDNFTSSNATDRYLIPSSCRYDGGRKVYFEGRRVILHDDIMAHREKGIHVVFADGSIEWLEAERTVQFMRAVASP